MTPRAIKATFSDWRTVKGRKSLQLIFEIPLEQQAEVLTMLGAPMPDNPVWCGIARLEEPAPAKPASDRSEKAREAYAAMDKMEQARVRAVRMCKDPAFQRWIAEELPHIEACGKTEEDKAAVLMRAGLEIASRSQIATNEQAYKRFLVLEAEFKAHTGQLAEARG